MSHTTEAMNGWLPDVRCPSTRTGQGSPRPVSAAASTAAVNWGDGKAYFFKGLLYASYDLKDNRITPGHPLPIALYWPGM